jgi:phosphoadenosine phosphosulfate reductase
VSVPELADLARVERSVDAVLAGGTADVDDGFRAVAEDEAEFIGALADEAATKLEAAPAAKILEWAATVVPRFAITSSFGADSAVLLHLVSEVAPHVPVLFLDTGLHFTETITFRRELATELGLSVVDVAPARSVAQQAAEHGDRLWERDPDRCCGLRKTAPLRQMMRSFDGWATGVRRVQTPERADVPVVESRRHDDRWLVKVAPLATWTDADVDTYLEVHDLPRHPLVADGYASIGCAPCTVRVAPGQDPRAGRWAAFGDKTECGLHLDASVEDQRVTTPG